MPRPVKMFRSENVTTERLPEKTMFGKPMEEWGFSWSRVDHRRMACAVAQIAQMDCALMFAPAAGGRGAACRLYQGKAGKTVVVLTPEEFNDLMDEYIDHFASPSEDVREIFGITNPPSRAAK